MSDAENIPAGSADYYIYSLNAEVEQIRKMLRRLEEVEVWEAYAASLNRAQETRATDFASPQELSFQEVRHASNLLGRAQTLLEKASRGMQTKTASSKA